MSVQFLNIHFFDSALKKAIYLVFAASLFLVSQLSFAQLPDFKSLVKESSPAVVNIATIKKKKKLGSFGFKGPKGEDLPEIFRQFIPELK